jgi:hypothetical protein
MNMADKFLFLDFALTFSRARLMLDDLQNAPTRRFLEEKLSQTPKGLTDLYAMITKRFSENLGKDRRLLCRRALQWIITTRKQLTLHQLAVALAIRDGQTSLDEVDIMFDSYEILTICAPLIEIVAALMSGLFTCL